MNNDTLDAQGTAEEPEVSATTNEKPSPTMTGRGYSPMSAEAWAAESEYLRQALHKIANSSAPEADRELLLVHQRGGPFREVRPQVEAETGILKVAVSVQNSKRQPRLLFDEVYLLTSRLLAFGGGLSVNDNGTGWAGLRPFGGDDRHMLGRLLKNAGRGHRAKQDPDTPHRDQSPQHFTKARAVPASSEPAMGRPYKDRKNAVETALCVYDRNANRAKFAVSREAYEQSLWDCFRLIDAYYGDDAA